MKLSIEEEVEQVEDVLEFHHQEIERLKKEIKAHKLDIRVLEAYLSGGCVIKAMQSDD